jgi:hypothetical protein
MCNIFLYVACLDRWENEGRGEKNIIFSLTRGNKIDIVIVKAGSGRNLREKE